MAGDPSKLVPFQWLPGTSGNPKGQSEARRRARRLREALDELLALDIPGRLLEQIDPDVLEMLPGDLSFAELLSLRLVMIAATARDAGDSLAAIRLVQNATQAPDPIGKPPSRFPPVLLSTEERRRSVLEQLGFLDDDQAEE